MKLIGKRRERLNSFGDSLAIKLKGEGQMRLSPALMSRLKIDANNNRIGIAYPSEGEKDLHIYTAPDGDGVAVNKQGYIKNIPHDRDIRSYMGLPGTGEEDMYVCEEAIYSTTYPEYVFYKIVKVEEDNDGWEENIEEEAEDVPVAYIKEHPPGEKSNEQKAQDTINDLHQAIEKSGGEVVSTSSSSEIHDNSTNENHTDDSQEVQQSDNQEDSNVEKEDDAFANFELK